MSDSNTLSLFSGGGQTVFGRVVATSKAIAQKRKLPPPAFKESRRVSQQASNKVTNYVRDILCLPRSWVADDGRIAIPRGERRSFLAETGLIGKVQFHSDMSEKEVRMEICKVFAKPMGLCVVTEEGDLLPFKYLQRTGAGSRTLCVPSVATTFEWNGRQVSTLAKSGGIINILADSTMPALTEVQW